MKDADKEKLKTLMLKLHKKYPQLSRVELEHQQDCPVWKQGKCKCKPRVNSWEAFVK